MIGDPMPVRNCTFMREKIISWLVGVFQYSRRGVIGSQNVKPSLLSRKGEAAFEALRPQSWSFPRVLMVPKPKCSTKLKDLTFPGKLSRPSYGVWQIGIGRRVLRQCKGGFGLGVLFKHAVPI